MRVHELGKKLNVDTKAIIGFLESKGFSNLAAVSAVPEHMLKDITAHFNSASAQEKKAAPKAVALPDSILKKVEADARAAEEKEQNRQSVSPKTNDRPKENPEKKKKKIIAVFNPQHASSDKAKAMVRQQREEKAPVREAVNKTAPAKRIPARDRVPDDERKAAVKRPLPSQLRPARDRIPDDELQEIKTQKQTIEEPKTSAAPVQELPKEEPVVKAPIVKGKVHFDDEDKPVHTQDEKTVSTKTPAAPSKGEEKSVAKTENKQSDKDTALKAEPEKATDKSFPDKPAEDKHTAEKPAADKPRESEAVKSLREKIVKGTVNVSDIKVTKRQNSGGRKDSDRQQPGKFKNEKDGKGKVYGQGGRNDRNAGQSQGRDNRPDNRSRNKNAGTAPAPAVNDNRGKGKGGRPQKGKFEKQTGDKFDRFENEKGLKKKQQETKETQEEIKVITIPDTISLKDFADKIKMQPSALIKKLFLQGKVYTVNDILDFETAENIALDMDIICEHEEVIDYIEELLKEEDEDESKMIKRPPVVCVMGHVDHGKTSLLDAIRNTNVIAREAGGITQHIGAYQVSLPSGDKITFLDTPGHEAFTAMRLRGAMATDVAILVVAADDGVMPQTIEAINHAKAAGIHVIVAINKIDKPGANIEKVKQELSDQGLVPEEWGGDTIFCPVSAKKGEGIQELLEMVILDTEILELKADPDRKARGLVIEAKLDKGRGAVVTLLVQKGTLKIGDHIAMGEAYGKVRSMTTADGTKVKEAGPSMPVEITGMNGVPNAGEVFVAYDSDKEAKSFAQVFIEENKKKLLAGTKSKMNLEDVFDQMKAGDVKDLEIIIKADVQGSVGALKESLEKLSNDEVNVRVIHSGVGNVNESDAILASASNAIIIAFNVNADAMARDIIDHEKVDMRKYNVIYSAIDDVTLAIKGMLKPVYEEVIVGHAEVRQIFKSSSTGLIAGSYITDGVVKRDSHIRLSRDGEQIYDGSISTLKRFADDVKEVRSGYECGITLKDFQDFREGDTLEAYEMKEVPRQ